MLTLIIWRLEQDPEVYSANEMGDLFWKLMNEGIPRTIGIPSLNGFRLNNKSIPVAIGDAFRYRI